jgi:UDP-glucuronate 4-epimerase
MIQGKKILVTGAAGFIGFHLANALLELGNEVIGLDNLNDYYEVSLKQARLDILLQKSNFIFEKIDLADHREMDRVYNNYRPQLVVNLAAQAGVRYSLENPYAYVESNINGFLNVLEGCRNYQVEHLVYASSSSVYGNNVKVPFSVNDRVDYPISLYAATKKADELMAYTYSHLYQLPTTGLRFFTVYGPWGRPDMAYFKFTKNILSGVPVELYNFGKHKRDFTYIDDIVEGLLRIINYIPSGGQTSNEPKAPYRLYNIGNNQPVELLYFIETLETIIGKKADIKYLPMQPGDVFETYADIDEITRAVGFKPKTALREGLVNFVRWYREFYRVNTP